MASKSPPLIGAHVSTSGGIAAAIDRACAIEAAAMQIFVKNNMQWFAKPIGAAEVAAFRDHPRRGDVRAVFGHSGYLINLAAVNEDFHARSLRSLREELARADQLELPFLVLHPGAHMGAGVEPGLEKIAASLDAVFHELPKVRTRVALETTAGQGTSLGHTFEQLAHIIARCREPERLCVCMDTAHLFAAGHDIATEAGTRRMFAEFKKIVGMDRLAAIHMNDSKTGLGSRVDRHEHIGRGKIGIEPFRHIMNAPALRKIPKVLETPKGKEMLEDVENLSVLRGLLK